MTEWPSLIYCNRMKYWNKLLPTWRNCTTIWSDSQWTRESHKFKPSNKTFSTSPQIPLKSMDNHHWRRATSSNSPISEIESTPKNHNWYKCNHRLSTCRINLEQSTYSVKNTKRNSLNSKPITPNLKPNLSQNLTFKQPSLNLHHNCKKTQTCSKCNEPKISSPKCNWPNTTKSPINSTCSKTNIMPFRKDRKTKLGH